MSDTEKSPDQIAADQRDASVKLLLGHASALGQLCMAWSVLDRTIDDLISIFLKTSPAQTASIVFHIDNMAARCTLLRRLVTLEDVGNEWREWFDAVINRVSVEIAPKRNRYIHDQWSITHESITRIDKRAQLRKPQANTLPTLEFDSRHVTDPHDVERLYQRVLLIVGALSLSVQSLRRWRQTGGHLALDPLVTPARITNARWLTPLEHLQALQSKQVISGYVCDEIA